MLPCIHRDLFSSAASMSTEYLNPTKKIRMIAIFHLFFSLYDGNNNSTHHFSVILEFWDVNTFVFERISGTGYMLYNYYLLLHLPPLFLSLFLPFTLPASTSSPAVTYSSFFVPFLFHGRLVVHFKLPAKNKQKNKLQPFPSLQVGY